MNKILYLTCLVLTINNNSKAQCNANKKTELNKILCKTLESRLCDYEWNENKSITE
jgi:hypothetical protein